MSSISNTNSILPLFILMMLHCAHRGSRADGNMPVETLFFLFVFVFKFSAGELSVSGVWKRVDLTAFAHASGPAAARASPAPVRLRASEFKCRRWLCFKRESRRTRVTHFMSLFQLRRTLKLGLARVWFETTQTQKFRSHGPSYFKFRSPGLRLMMCRGNARCL